MSTQPETRIARRFAALKAEGRGGLVTFLTAGDPDPETALDIMMALPEAGADLIEIGVPFSDPMADGPAIQASSLRAIKAGMTLAKVLGNVRAFRQRDDDTPIILMGYYNPIYVYGVDVFLRDAKEAGVDGFIVVDLPPEEEGEFCLPALEAGLNFIFLTAPTTDDQRLPRVLEHASGFVYFVSITGITGTKSAAARMWPGMWAVSASSPICPSPWVLASRRRSKPPRLSASPMRQSSARPWWQKYRQSGCGWESQTRVERCRARARA